MTSQSLHGKPTVDLNQLKAVVVRLLDEAIADNASASFELDNDFYWQIAFDERFDMSCVPSPGETGSLLDDWEMTRSLADEPTKVAPYSLTEVAPLLDYVGHKLVQRLPRSATEIGT